MSSVSTLSTGLTLSCLSLFRVTLVTSDGGFLLLAVHLDVTLVIGDGPCPITRDGYAGGVLRGVLTDCELLSDAADSREQLRQLRALQP